MVRIPLTTSKEFSSIVFFFALLLNLKFNSKLCGYFSSRVVCDSVSTPKY